jgi:GSH-dependent disulfide-bond oxidoreductase
MTHAYQLFTANTPNGVKIPIALEEIRVGYDMSVMRLDPASLLAPEYLAINPNAKIPALRHRLPSGEHISLFESGAILLYLAQHHGMLLGDNAQGRADTLSWLFLQVAGLGPMMGQAGHFLAMNSPDPYALGRFEGEARRLFALIEARLEAHAWLNRETYSIADIAHFAWARRASYAGLDLLDYPAITRWVAQIEARPATRRALLRLA